MCGAVATTVSIALPTQPDMFRGIPIEWDNVTHEWWRSSYGHPVTEQQLVKAFGYQGYEKPNLIIVDEVAWIEWSRLLDPSSWDECA